MFVEKLSLFGFKSFNQKVSLEFGSGISGVIGPNGCGKSNIVDAIRWVLGEQSTKQLRGAKMEDVIFNGTREEKPLSLAEVSLTLNNERGRLPIEYGTVTVGRRLYRSGVSEYTINKQPVRLKDVRELFLDTGMGSHAYSVIERQMVDNILSDTTGHRRFLFEEAAGIMKYKTRKKEALNKLEATERDLVRVNDIISEVERQVASLRRQVGKARRYRALTEEIRGIDLAWSQLTRRNRLEKIAELEAAHRETSRTAEAGEVEVARLEAELEQLHLTVLEEERRLAEAREKLARTDDQIGTHGSRIMVLRERLDATRLRIQEAQELRVRLTDRLERNVVASGEVDERLRGLAEREITERERLDAGESGLRAAEERVRGQRVAASDRLRETSRLRDERIRAEADTAAMAERLRDLDARVAQIEEKLSGARTRREEVEAKLAAARAAAEEARAHEAGLAVREQTLAGRRRDLDERTEALRGDLAQRRQDQAAARSRLATLENLRDRYEGFAPGVRALMLDEQRDEGVLGTLGDLIQVPGEWVEALEPALSSAWQYVVVRDTDTARRLLDRLRGESLGFAALLPLDRVPAVDPAPASFRRAADVVDARDEAASLVRYLLGDLALAEDLDEALRLVGEGIASRAATRQGQYVDGAVVAGGRGGPAGAELLERQESLERCRREIEGLADALAGLGGREAELAAERDALDREGRELEEEIAGARRARDLREKEEAELALTLRHAADALADFAAERDRLRERIEALGGEREALARRLETAGTEEQAAAGRLAEAEEALARVEAERERVLDEVHGMRMSWARLEGELKDARAAGERLRTEHRDLGDERDRTARDEEENHRRVGEIEEELEDLADKVQVLHREREERLAVVGEREREKSEAAAREQQDSDALREVRRRASVARQAAHRTELELSEVRGEVKHLEERLREEYDVTPADLDRVEVGEPPENAPEILAEMKDRLKRIGPVNLLAVEEYEEKRERFEFMSTQRDDLVDAKDSLVKTIEQINRTASKMFTETFAQVQENFQKTFQVLFQGGECQLSLVGDDPLEADIDVTARPRGKRPQGIHQLSSGERALTAIALLFAIYLVKPSPFCILDEVDAPLDDANIDRFVAMVKEFSHRTQFIVITHNKKTMEAADCLYGVTMQRPGVSSVVSVRLDGLERDRAEDRPARAVRPGNGNGGNGGGHDAREEPEAEGPSSPESIIAQ